MLRDQRRSILDTSAGAELLPGLGVCDRLWRTWSYTTSSVDRVTRLVVVGAHGTRAIRGLSSWYAVVFAIWSRQRSPRHTWRHQNAKHGRNDAQAPAKHRKIPVD